MAERFGVEGRGAFYDEVGAIRDVVQNHMLQVVANLAMEPPVGAGQEALRDERVKVLRAIRPLTPGGARARPVRGLPARARRRRGLGGGDLRGDAARASTPGAGRACRSAFASASDCRSRRPRSRVALRRPPQPSSSEPRRRRKLLPLPARARAHARSRSARARRSPDRAMVGADVELFVSGRSDDEMQAYERLLGDALQGDATLFTRQDAVEAAWRIVDPVLDRGPPPRRTAAAPGVPTKQTASPAARAGTTPGSSARRRPTEDEHPVWRHDHLYLVGDVGATHARLAITTSRNGGIDWIHEVRLADDEFATFDAAVDRVFAASLGRARAHRGRLLRRRGPDRGSARALHQSRLGHRCRRDRGGARRRAGDARQRPRSRGRGHRCVAADRFRHVARAPRRPGRRAPRHRRRDRPRHRLRGRVRRRSQGRCERGRTRGLRAAGRIASVDSSTRSRAAGNESTPSMSSRASDSSGSTRRCAPSIPDRESPELRSELDRGQGAAAIGRFALRTRRSARHRRARPVHRLLRQRRWRPRARRASSRRRVRRRRHRREDPAAPCRRWLRARVHGQGRVRVARGSAFRSPS